MLLLLLLTAFAPTVHCGDAGILYEVWHTWASNAMAQVQQKNGMLLTTEQVIRSNGGYTLDDVYNIYGISGDIWNVQPQLGFYCLYRQRPGDTDPPVPDCPNITQTATQHANWIYSAGIDYINVDITNWPTVSEDTDVWVLRPTEVLFQEWLALRQKGIPTPQIAVWPCSPAGSNTWQWLLDNLYNNASYAPLIYTQNGKKVVFLPDNPSCYDASVEQQIQSNGGRNDVTTIKMWALFGIPSYQQGSWGFFSPCTETNNPNAYTTSMVDTGDCNQPVTTDPNGNVVAVTASGSYMLSQTAMPFASAGKFRGLTIQRLFKKIFTLNPPHIFLSSFNEHIGGRQAPASGAKIAFNMGLPTDSQRYSVWVDSYAAEFSRDMEPTIEGGSRVWEVASSCVTLYKLGQNCTTAPSSACCTTADKEIFESIWSLKLPDGSDYLLTNSSYERSVLLSSGWVENCNPIPNPSAFCVNTAEPDGRAGPFMVYNVQQPNTIPLYRCYTSGGHHFFSTASNCEGQKTEYMLGYIATQRGGEMLRALWRCLGTKPDTHLQSLDLQCDIYDTGVLGYVR